ncbi:6-phosphogluconolactonase [Nocardioides sp.]|uniref:6-phosphogluconolactonase n=1 Tax=Nocardioides sp. TaxID=35761 RepID=UPI0031FF1B1E|nr:6-phosphogluconolactonase [Nocardioides sp.]
MSSPRIEVHEDASDLATAAAGELLMRLVDGQSEGGVPHIGLTGGGIAESVHREIARLAPLSEVDWNRVVVWWGDERFVAPDSPDRNALDARASFLSVVGIPEQNIHEMPSTATAESAEAGATAYGDDLRAQGVGQFEVLMLGMGPDGHVASLFPGHAALDVSDQIAVAVLDSPKPPPERISLTFAALNHSKSVWFLVSGEAKADAVARALAGTGEGGVAAEVHDVPAVGVTGHDETIWFLDRASASHL